MDDQELLDPTEFASYDDSADEPELPEQGDEPEEADGEGQDWEAERDTLYQYVENLQGQTAAYQQVLQQQQQMQAQEAANMWRIAEQQLHRQTRDMHPDEAIAITQRFYAEKDRFVAGQVAQMAQQVHAERVSAYADNAIRETGLSPEDKQHLMWIGMTDPNAIPYEAQRIAQWRQYAMSETEQLRRENDNLKRAVQAGNIRQSGAWNTGGARGQAPGRKYEPGSMDHLRDIFYGPPRQR